MTDRRGRGGWFGSGSGGGGGGGDDMGAIIDRLDKIADRLERLEDKVWTISNTTTRLEAELFHKPSKGWILTVCGSLVAIGVGLTAAAVNLVKLIP